ncbi:MAG: hypothetical protein AAF401_17780 [Pseudomonadota bacterium]
MRPPSTLPDPFPEPRFRALDGHAELAVAEAAASGAPRPLKVSAVLEAVLDRIGGEPSTRAARRVSAAGREWLLHRAALRFGGAGEWFETQCDACGARFDLRLSLRDIPRASPTAAFPVAEVETSIGVRSFEAPNGGHEEAFARRGSEDPRRVFAALCGLSDRAEAEAIRFHADDLELIDTALEAASPDIADGVDAVCPDCGSEIRARIDPLDFAFPTIDRVLGEVHLIASAYHWSEASILDMSLSRRAAYARLIGAEQRSGRRLS